MNRTDRLRSAFDSLNIDAAVIYGELNQRYLSGFAFTDGLLLITKAHAYLVTDFRYYEMAHKGAFPEYEVVIPDNKTEFIAKVLKDDECKCVGFEGDFVSFSLYSKLCDSHKNIKFVSLGGIIEEQRQIKDASEIKTMQRAQDITDKAFSEILKVLTPEMTEIEVAAELEYQMRRNGASGLAFETIAVSGDASSLPHGAPRNQKLQRGFLTMDFGANVDGYCSDMTRTVCIGRADEDIKRLYNTVLSAQLAALSMLKAGVDCKNADKAARDIIDGIEEYKGTFGHSLGHGVGLFIHEDPRLAKTNGGRILRVGEIVTVEPGIYLYGKYGCRIEDMVAIEENGIYNFTASPKELIEIL